MNETNNTTTAFKAFPAILLCYFAPIFGLILLSRLFSDHLNVLTLGLVITALGTFFLYSLIQRSVLTVQIEAFAPAYPPAPLAEPSAPPVDTAPLLGEIALLKQSVAEHKNIERDWEEKLTDFTETLNELTHLKQENESLHKQVQSAVTRYRELQESQSTLLQDHQRTIAELRGDLAQRQQLGDQLEGKVRDLSYELKTLLRLAEKPLHAEPKHEPSAAAIAVKEENDNDVLNAPVHTREEAHVHLKRCLDIAQRVTGAGYLTNSPKFQEFAPENSALELRRLGDKLRDVDNNALIVFSPKENKLIYANDRTKQIVGMNLERFLENFHELIHNDYAPWKNALQQLSFKNDAHVILPIRVRPGEAIQIECLLGIIQTGLFRNNIVGLLYT